MKFNIDNLIESGIVLVTGIILYWIIKYIFKKAVFKRVDKKANTPLFMFFSYVKYFYFIIIILIVLKVNGIDVSAMLAGVGIASIIIGLAIQDALKDIIRGVSIISEGYYKIGDVIKFNDNTGIVLELGMKTTKIKDIYTNNIVSIANRNIEKVEIMSDSLYLNIPMPYEVSIKDAEECIGEIVNIIKENEKVLDVAYKGISELADSSIDYKLFVKVDPKNMLQTRRDCLRDILLVMDKHNIEVPYNQLDIHNK